MEDPLARVARLEAELAVARQQAAAAATAAPAAAAGCVRVGYHTECAAAAKPPPLRQEQVATTTAATAAPAASCRGLPGGCGGKAARLAARGSDSRERPRHHVSKSSCRVTPPASLDFTTQLSPRGPWSQLNVSEWHYRLHPLSYNTSEQAVLDAIWASQFRDGCDRLLLFEDDMRGAGLGFASAIIGNLLLYAFVNNLSLIHI